MFYLIAVHHLHSAIFYSDNSSLQNKLLQSVMQLKDKVVLSLILCVVTLSV